MVDDKDFAELSKHKWHTQGRSTMYYASRQSRGTRGVIYMHREIIMCPKGLMVDHVNHNRLDNRRDNLRVCTASQNQANSRLHKTTKSGYKGVVWDKSRKKWMVHTKLNQKDVYIGRFFCVVKAAKAYDKIACELFGEFAKLNFPRKGIA